MGSGACAGDDYRRPGHARRRARPYRPDFRRRYRFRRRRHARRHRHGQERRHQPQPRSGHRRGWSVHDHEPPRWNVRPDGHGPGLQALRAEGHRAGRHRASGAACHRARDRRLVGGRVGRGRVGQGSDDQRRAFGDDHRQPDRGHRPQRPRLHGQPQDAARRHRHVGARRPGLGLGRQHDDQRPDVVQLLLRRRHEQGHRLELGQLCRAGARLHRRSEGAGVELPGRVRPQLRRDDHGRHQERHARLSRHGCVLQAQREVQHQLLGSPPPVRRGPGRELRQGALPVRQHGVDDRRSGSGSGHRLQQEPRQAVLLLLAGPPAAQRSGQPAAEHDADGARAFGRLLADVR